MSHENEIDRNKHAVFVLDQMEEMMREEDLCDFIIKIGSEEIKTHRLVLAAASNYFRSMLRSDTQQSQSGFVDMFNVDLESVKICIDFIYNKAITIPVEKYKNLLYVANMMQLKKLCDYIYTKIGKRLDSQSFFAAITIADEYGNEELADDCMKFAEANLVSISKEDGFKDLDMEYVHQVISSKNVKMTEEEKLDVILRFAHVDKEKSLADVIDWVDLEKVSLERKEDIMNNEPLVKGDIEVYKIFSASAMNALKQMPQTHKIGTPTSVETKVTCKNEISIGEELDPGLNAKQTTNHPLSLQKNQSVASLTSAGQLGAARRAPAIALFDKGFQHSLHFSLRSNTMTQTQQKFPTIKERVYSVAAMDDYVCVLFGQMFRRFKHFDAISHWEQMPNMICGHGLRPPVTVTINCMYVCGGSDPTTTAAFEKFDLRKRRWERLKDKPRATRDCTALASNGNVFSFGGGADNLFGIGFEGATKIVESFNISASTWSKVAPMKYARWGAAAVEANKSVYVLGGWGGWTALDKVERYCVLSNQWTEIKPMKIARHRLKAFYIYGTIYSVGGWKPDAAQRSIEKYHVARDEWEVVELPSTEEEFKIYESVQIKI